MSLSERMHKAVREMLAAETEAGRLIDKRQARYNVMVDAAIRYGEMSDPFSEAAAWGGLREVVSACVVGDPMHVPGGNVSDLAPEWMISR